MAQYYPFKSKLKRRLAKYQAGVDYALWQEDNFALEAALSKTNGDLLELAGPSFDGYYFLDDIKLPRPLTISNLHDKPFADSEANQRANNYISQHIDAAWLPQEAGTLGAVLCHNLPYAAEDKPAANRPQNVQRRRYAQTEMGEIILGLRLPRTALTALRVRMLREAYRVLEPGGILITDGQLAELEIMNQIGFKPRTIICEGLSMEEIVLQKLKEVSK